MRVSCPFPGTPTTARRLPARAVHAACVGFAVAASPLAAAQAVASPQPASAAADHERSFPQRRPGLWEVRSVGAQASGLESTKLCVGPDTDTATQHLDRSVGRRGSCEFGPFEPAGEAWLAESVCREGRTTVSSRSVATGDFEHRYRIDTVVQYDPPLAGTRREDKDALEARWLGPCARGQKPGDIVVPGMGTLNMVDGQFRAEPDPPARGNAARARSPAAAKN